MSKDEIKVKIEEELRGKIKGKHGGLEIVDNSKKSISHFIFNLNHMTLRNYDRELWINSERRLVLEYSHKKIPADFYFEIIMDTQQHYYLSYCKLAL